MNKHYKIAIIILVAAFVVPQMTLAAWWNPLSWGVWNRIFHFQQTNIQQLKPIGGDKDSRGCLIAAGYSWCQEKQKCLRPWEEACNINSDVYPLFSGPKWSNQSPKTINEPVSNLAISGYEITSEGQINNNQDASEFVKYYNEKLKASGWTVDNNFAADGITGSQVGYQKDGNYIVLSYKITPGKITSRENEPLQWQCPCKVDYFIFTTSSKDDSYFEIKELKLKFKITKGIEDLKYSLRVENNSTNVVFSTKSLSAKDQGCDLSSAPIGSIFVSHIAPNSNSFYNQSRLLLGDGGLYVYYNSPQAPCSTDTKINKLQSEQTHLLSSALKMIIKVK